MFTVHQNQMVSGGTKDKVRTGTINTREISEQAGTTTTFASFLTAKIIWAWNAIPWSNRTVRPFQIRIMVGTVRLDRILSFGFDLLVRQLLVM